MEVSMVRKSEFIVLMLLLMVGIVSAISIEDTLGYSDTTNPITSKDYVTSREVNKIIDDYFKMEFNTYNPTKCSHLGLIINETYCGEAYHTRNGNQIYDGLRFQEQKGEGYNCTYDFECKSNFCFNQECVNGLPRLMGDFLQKIEKLENRIKELERQRNFLEENIGNITAEVDMPKQKNFFFRLFQ